MSTSIHRRSFLGSAALGAAASGLNISAKNSARYDSPNSRVVIGIMGMSRGSRLAKNLGSQPNVDLKYICDVDSLRLEKVAHMVDKELGKTPRKVADFRRILEDPEVDALVNAGPNHWHAPATILACSAGKHVYVEGRRTHGRSCSEIQTCCPNGNPTSKLSRNSRGYSAVAGRGHWQGLHGACLAKQWKRNIGQGQTSACASPFGL